jgi:hypothetical protein
VTAPHSFSGSVAALEADAYQTVCGQDWAAAIFLDKEKV